MIKEDLIFDLGFHNGDDTDFYLRKGFSVVAVEADPGLVEEGLKRFAKDIAAKKLILLNKAVSANQGRQNFYIHPNKSDWSSCDKAMAESDGSRARTVSVAATSFNNLCQEYGTPWYAKIDIEGCDLSVAEELCSLAAKPPYISFELSKRDYAGIFSCLRDAGYKKFQLVNQLNNPGRLKDPNQQTFEGKNINYQFSKYSSGFFGKDLPANNWLAYDEALGRYLKYRELKIIDNQELALGWLDLHASL